MTLYKFYETFDFKQDYEAKPGQTWVEISNEVYGAPIIAPVLRLVNQNLFDLDERESPYIEKTITIKVPEITYLDQAKSELPIWRDE